MDKSSRKQCSLAWSTQTVSGRFWNTTAPWLSSSTRFGSPVMNITSASAVISFVDPGMIFSVTTPVITTATRRAWRVGPAQNATPVGGQTGRLIYCKWTDSKNVFIDLSNSVLGWGINAMWSSLLWQALTCTDRKIILPRIPRRSGREMTSCS